MKGAFVLFLLVVAADLNSADITDNIADELKTIAEDLKEIKDELKPSGNVEKKVEDVKVEVFHEEKKADQVKSNDEAGKETKEQDDDVDELFDDDDDDFDDEKEKDLGEIDEGEEMMDDGCSSISNARRRGMRRRTGWLGIGGARRRTTCYSCDYNGGDGDYVCRRRR